MEQAAFTALEVSIRWLHLFFKIKDIKCTHVSKLVIKSIAKTLSPIVQTEIFLRASFPSTCTFSCRRSLIPPSYCWTRCQAFSLICLTFSPIPCLHVLVSPPSNHIPLPLSFSFYRLNFFFRFSPHKHSILLFPHYFPYLISFQKSFKSSNNNDIYKKKKKLLFAFIFFQLVEELKKQTSRDDVKELCALFSKPHFKVRLQSLHKFVCYDALLNCQNPWYSHKNNTKIRIFLLSQEMEDRNTTPH